MNKRIFALLLSILMMLPLTVSCSESENKNKDDSATKEYDGIVIDDDYVVIRADNAPKSDVRTAVNLRTQINSKASLNISIKTDYYTTDGGKDSKEILVGATNRKTEFDRTTLKDGEYYIGIEGNRIIIDAYDSVALRYAVDYFVKNWLTEDLGIQKDGVLLMNEEICASLTGVDVYPKNTIRILSQNMYYSETGRGTRMNRFQKVIEQYDPDIIGTQETTNKWLNDFKTKLTGYGVVGYSRDGKNASGGEWNAILYKLDRFELLDSDTIWLSDTPTKTSRLPGSLCNRICTWALLKDKETNRKILMCNTHLDHGTDEVREKQVQILLNYLKKRYPNYPAFITGDFNCEPTSLAYKAIEQTWSDSHVETLVNRSTISNTFNADNPSKEIDFCFYRGNKAVPLYYYIINEKIDDGYVSDHLGVLAEFALK